MNPVTNLPTIEGQATSAPTVGAPPSDLAAKGAKGASSRFWASLRPLAYLAPLAINWPGGRMAM